MTVDDDDDDDDDDDVAFWQCQLPFIGKVGLERVSTLMLVFLITSFPYAILVNSSSVHPGRNCPPVFP